MKDYKNILEPGNIYHIYNHSNGNDKLFLSNDNYFFFLRKYKQYISPVANTYCYCLMPDYFHFVVRIKEEDDLTTALAKTALSGFQTLTGLEKQAILSKHTSQQFSHLFNAYTQAYNKQNNRRGSLFQRPFNRLNITDHTYLLKLVHYIHYNPVKAHLCNKPEDWQFSSYNAIVSNKKTMINKKDVLNWFGDLNNFIFCHQHPPELTGIDQV